MPATYVDDIDLSLYGGTDPRDIPAYSILQAAHHLRIPRSTLRMWVQPQRRRFASGHQIIEPLIELPTLEPPLFSFRNLVEVHILDALRYQHRISLRMIRGAINNLRQKTGSKHPLVDWDFQTDGKRLLIEELGELVDAVSNQIVMRQVLEVYLQRVELDRMGGIARLFPFITKSRPEKMEKEPKVVVIDPLISFGRPVLAQQGIPTEVIYDRWLAGDSIDFLADDYGCLKAEIKAAIRYEEGQRTKKAA
jgi:uncharacterized protein (DUF433 family)